MNEQGIIMHTLNKAGAIITNSHVVYTTGDHGSAYINKDALYLYTKKTSLLCSYIAKKFARDNIEVVAGGASGGIVISQWVAHHLSKITHREILSTYADKQPNKEFVIKRGYDKIIPRKRILVVEDVLNTGDSAKRVIEAVRAINGTVIGLGALCNRGSVTPQDVNTPQIQSLVNMSLKAWSEWDCPLCKNDVPINTTVGKGREFLAKKNQ